MSGKSSCASVSASFVAQGSVDVSVDNACMNFPNITLHKPADESSGCVMLISRQL